MSRELYFKDLPLATQEKILDDYGADSAEELDLDKKPIVTVCSDGDEIEALVYSRI